jgi:hypothetical protein
MNPIQKYVLQQYRVHDEEDSARRKKTALAANYWKLQKDLAERARLYDLDTGAENILSPHEMSRRAAARAGLQLPKLHTDYQEEDDAAAGNQ